MIDPAKFKSPKFSEVFEELENLFLNELENLLINQLIEQKEIRLHDFRDETLEFAGRTNFKLTLKRPNKNVWSVSLKTLHDALRHILREGKVPSLDDKSLELDEHDRLPIIMLVHCIPEQEYQVRSFVGNIVEHEVLGEGRILRIGKSGNVEVQFHDRKAKLKPDFVTLKLPRESSVG